MYAHVALSPIGAADRSTNKRSSIAGPEEMNNGTTGSTLGVHVTKANFQKLEVLFLEICSSHMHTQRHRTLILLIA